MAPRVYLDTNAVSHFFTSDKLSEPDKRELRARIREAASACRFEFVISISQLEELAEFSRFDWTRYRHFYDFLFELSGPRLLLEYEDRLEGEIRTGSILVEPEMYCSRHFRRQLQAATKVRSNAMAVADAARQRKQKWKAFGDAMRGRQIEGMSRIRFSPKMIDRALSVVGSTIDEQTVDYLQNRRAELGLPQEASHSPIRNIVPSAWLMFAYWFGRTVLTGKGYRIEPSDIYDVEHFSAGGYFDVLVTQDKDFTKICQMVSDLPFETKTVEQFVELL